MSRYTTTKQHYNPEVGQFNLPISQPLADGTFQMYCEIGVLGWLAPGLRCCFSGRMPGWAVSVSYLCLVYSASSFITHTFPSSPAVLPQPQRFSPTPGHPLSPSLLSTRAPRLYKYRRSTSPPDTPYSPRYNSCRPAISPAVRIG